MQTSVAGWLDNQDRPFRGKRQPRQQWRNLGFSLTAAVDDQPAMVEAVQTDPRATASPREPGELLDARFWHAGQAQDRPRNGEAELGPDPQANMLRRRSVDSNPSRRQGGTGFEHSGTKPGDDLFD